MSNSDVTSYFREGELFVGQKDVIRAMILLDAIKERQEFVAKRILKKNPNIHYKDETGCQSLHYAAQEGFLDLVKTLIEEGAHVNCFDRFYQSPLHKASSSGHVDVVINLVANGAQIGSLDWANHTPFEKAVISRSVGVVEILLMFGAEPNLQDWSWTMENLGEKEIKIQELITDHVPLVPGYKYEGIQFEVVFVKPNEDITLDKLRLTLSAIDVRNTFIFFCRKMQSEYTELKWLLHEDQTPYSDMFELQTWEFTRKTLTLKVYLEGIPNNNEQLVIISHDKQIGRVDNLIKNEDDNTTEVTLTIKINARGLTQFAIASVFKKETFAISEEEVVIKPTAEPKAEIEIPKGTFEKAAELQLNVVDTNDVNEDEEDESGPLLMTNVIDMSMSDGQQPKEEIVMKLPIHKNGDELEEMCVLATSEEDPDDVDDWEVIEAQTDLKGKAAVFKIKHLSYYAGANKMNVLEDKQAVISVILRSIKRERKLTFKGNCRKVSSETPTPVKEEENNDDAKEERNENKNKNADIKDNDFVILDFVGKKGYSFTIVDMVVLDTDKPTGKVIINKEIRAIEMIEQKVSKPSGICEGKSEVITVQNITFRYEDLADLVFEVKLPQPPQPSQPPQPPQPVREPTNILIQTVVDEKKLEEFVEKTEVEYPSFVTGMDMKNLASIVVQLTKEEARIFGKNLGLQNDDIEKFMKLPSGAVFMIRKYRGKRPHKYQKVKIQRALEAIDRHDLVPLIMPEETEKNTNAIEKILDNEGSYGNGMMDGNEVISEIVEESKEKPTKLKNVTS